MRKEKLLVLGASGFLGQQVIKRLSSEMQWDIYAVSSGRKQISFPAMVKKLCVDLLNDTQRQELMESIKPSVILHLAWETGDMFSDINLRWLEASLHLMRLFALHGGKRFLFAGSCREIRNISGKRAEENQTMSSLCIYGASKLAFTNLAIQFLGSRNIDFVNLRYFTLYGPGDMSPIGGIPTAVRAFLKKDVFVCKNPNNILDYVYITDAAEATLCVLKTNFSGLVNIASGLPVCTVDMFSEIADILDCRKLLIIENDDICQTVLVGDTAVLHNKIGYVCKTKFHEGIRTTIQWFKEHAVS